MKGHPAGFPSLLCRLLAMAPFLGTLFHAQNSANNPERQSALRCNTQYQAKGSLPACCSLRNKGRDPQPQHGGRFRLGSLSHVEPLRYPKMDCRMPLGHRQGPEHPVWEPLGWIS